MKKTLFEGEVGDPPSEQIYTWLLGGTIDLT